MPYPPAPWKLNGVALVAPRLIDIDRARMFVPRDLPIIPVLPGKTLGMVFAAYYAPGSDMNYSELIVAPALTSHGLWISHIYVDEENSMAGGRDIWGLPKELAHFSWNPNGRAVEVHQGERLLAGIDHTQPIYTLPIWIMTTALSMLGTDLLKFRNHFRGGVGFSASRLHVPDESPFAVLQFAERAPMLHLRHLRLRVDAPQVIGHIRADDQVLSV